MRAKGGYVACRECEVLSLQDLQPRPSYSGLSAPPGEGPQARNVNAWAEAKCRPRKRRPQSYSSGL